MSTTDPLAIGGMIGGAVAIAQFAYGIWKDRHDGTLRKGRAEAAKQVLDAAQAEASLPHVQESLRLGNLDQAITIQQQVINGLREHAAWQDTQLALRDQRIAELEQRLKERDDQIDALEERLGIAEGNLADARHIIELLRADQHAQARTDRAGN